MTGTETALVAVEPGTSTQFVPSPTSRELVWTCKVQPVWSCGQESVNVPPLTLVKMFVGFGLTVTTATTAMVPSTASRLVQYKPVPGNAGSVTVLNAPLMGVLNSVNVSPAARLVEPMFAR